MMGFVWADTDSIQENIKRREEYNLENNKSMPSGGSGRNQGRKLKYGEPVKRILVKVPISKEKEIKEQINAILKKYIVNN